MRRDGSRCVITNRTKPDVCHPETRVNQRVSNAVSIVGSTVRDQSGRIAESERLFTVQVESKGLGKFKAVINAQWLAICIASLSGAGECSDELDLKSALMMFMGRWA